MNYKSVYNQASQINNYLKNTMKIQLNYFELRLFILHSTDRIIVLINYLNIKVNRS